MAMKNIRRSGLAVMVAVCVAAMAGGTAQAQSATGAVVGRAKPGTQVVIVNPATGFSRTVNVAADGSYRFTQLPVGDYRLQTDDGRELGVSVSLGGTTTANLVGSADTLDTVQVVGSRIVNRVDVNSTEVSTHMNREELARLPVAQDMSAVALLAPGVISGNASFGGISFGGASVAENSVFVNGLNVTDFYRRQSFSSAPYAFFQEFQVKTGGYSVEFGRSTGGVINAVTRSGSNEFHGGVEFTWQPEWGYARTPDRYYRDGTLHSRGSQDKTSSLKSNIWASGPLLKDRLFLFAMYEDRDSRSYYTNSAGTSLSKSRNSGNGFWGAKLDWNITDNHQLALLAFSDDSASTITTWSGYDFDSRTRPAQSIDTQSESGGLNWSASYTGRFGENFTAKALYGINRSKSKVRTPLDKECDWVSYNTATYGAVYDAMGRPVLGCHPGRSIVDHEDQRKVARLDFEWALGSHLLRFGMDKEVMVTNRTQFYPGSGVQYVAYGTTPGSQLDNGAIVPDGVQAILMGRRRSDGGEFETTANAWYVEDIWNVTPNFLLNIGVRVDSFNNKTASGASFIKMDNLVSPRLGFSWDFKGDGTAKLFGNLGRYYLPVTNNINYTFAGGLVDERTFHVLEGWKVRSNPDNGAHYMAPIIGAQIGGVDSSYNISVADLRKSVDKDLDAVYQDELILGYQSMLSEAWSWGVNASYRRMHNALDDVRINHTPCGPVGRNLWPIANPGKPLTIWGDASIGCANEGWITIDTAQDGYRKGGSGEVVGYFEPKRTYRSLELQIDRAWDGKWAFNASYLWSKSEGNHEGPVNSDTNYGDTGMVQHWDHPANNQRYGVLFNDRRHQIKLRAAYALSDAWSIGGNLQVQSGGPITAFGVTWPNDSSGAASFVTEGSGGGSGWICQPVNSADECASWQGRPLVYSPRGAFGRLPWTWSLGANLSWRKALAHSELKATLSVFNLTNNQRVLNVHSRYEAGPGVYRSTFGQGTGWQSPRYTQLVLGWSF
ncbi:energy transducer TonB [Lysobacteraceae bacterium NML08-0793]|nr:energy transducer TonB [Xanthomonadaceae bacterium NML08-0793]